MPFKPTLPHINDLNESLNTFEETYIKPYKNIIDAIMDIYTYYIKNNTVNTVLKEVKPYMHPNLVAINNTIVFFNEIKTNLVHKLKPSIKRYNKFCDLVHYYIFYINSFYKYILDDLYLNTMPRLSDNDCKKELKNLFTLVEKKINELILSINYHLNLINIEKKQNDTAVTMNNAEIKHNLSNLPKSILYNTVKTSDYKITDDDDTKNEIIIANYLLSKYSGTTVKFIVLFVIQYTQHYVLSNTGKVIQLYTFNDIMYTSITTNKLITPEKPNTKEKLIAIVDN